eukprot:1514707-Prymnesium_polylepis.1
MSSGLRAVRRNAAPLKVVHPLVGVRDEARGADHEPPLDAVRILRASLLEAVLLTVVPVVTVDLRSGLAVPVDDQRLARVDHARLVNADALVLDRVEERRSSRGGFPAQIHSANPL